MNCQSRYLLVLACSQRKRSELEPLAAIDRYDGVNYRLLRKLGREGRWPDSVDVLILSAKHGLLRPDTLIEDYDFRMTPQRAEELRPFVTLTMKAQLESARYTEVYVNVGKAYMLALEGSIAGMANRTRVICASGGIGARASQMRCWLLDKTSTTEQMGGKK